MLLPNWKKRKQVKERTRIRSVAESEPAPDSRVLVNSFERWNQLVEIFPSQQIAKFEAQPTQQLLLPRSPEVRERHLRNSVTQVFELGDYSPNATTLNKMHMGSDLE
jgi:hypothetical protein